MANQLASLVNFFPLVNPLYSNIASTPIVDVPDLKRHLFLACIFSLSLGAKLHVAPIRVVDDCLTTV